MFFYSFHAFGKLHYDKHQLAVVQENIRLMKIFKMLYCIIIWQLPRSYCTFKVGEGGLTSDSKWGGGGAENTFFPSSSAGPVWNQFIVFI